MSLDAPELAIATRFRRSASGWMLDPVVKAGGRVITSDRVQNLIRGVFGVLLGGR